MIPVDYEILRLIWWLFLGVLLIGFAIMDGFDLGVATLLPFVARTDVERRIAINTVGPVWDGNQVWLILGGGAIFAAWPAIYAASFSGFYIAMFLVLATLILRPVGFEFRTKMPSPAWRTFWDYALFAGGLVPSLVFGVAFGNILQGVPFHIDADARVFYEGSGLFELLNPFGLLAGLVSVAMLAMHGGAWLGLKADGPVAVRARAVGRIAALATIVLFALGGVALWLFVDGYAITSAIDPNGPSNPLAKEVALVPGGWFANYAAHPLLLAVPALGFLGAIGAYFGLSTRREGLTFLASKLSVVGIVATVGVSMFPMILPSSVDPRSSLTVFDASSSRATLFNMLVVALVGMPIVVAYTAWVYRVLWGKVDERTIARDADHAY